MNYEKLMYCLFFAMAFIGILTLVASVSCMIDDFAKVQVVYMILGLIEIFVGDWGMQKYEE